MLPVFTSLQQLHKEARDLTLALHDLMLSLSNSNVSLQENINHFLEEEKKKCEKNPERFVQLSEDAAQIWQELETALAAGESLSEIHHIVYCHWSTLNHVVSGIAHMDIIQK